MFLSHQYKPFAGLVTEINFLNVIDSEVPIFWVDNILKIYFDIIKQIYVHIEMYF